MKRILITHNDLDACGIRTQSHLLKIKGLYDFATFFHYNYDDEAKMQTMIMDDYDLREIIYADFAPSPEIYKYCRSKRICVKIFDHHLTAVQKFSDENGNILIPNYIFDNNRSGTKIFYEEFYKPLAGSTPYLDYFVSLVDTYDLWKESNSLWEEANDLQRVFSGTLDYRSTDMYSKFITIQVQKALNMDNFEFIPIEKSVIAKMKQKEQDVLAHGRDTVQFRVDSTGLNYMYLQLKSKISFVASNLLRENPECKYIIIRNLYTGGSEHSLRCKDGFDVRQIAEKFGGGGHSLAAGVSLPETMANDLLLEKIHLN